MADAVVRLHEEQALRDRLVLQAQSDIEDFTWDRSLDRMEELLHRFSADSPPRADELSQ